MLPNMIGTKFSRLTVIEESISTNCKRKYWKCLCECGNEKIIDGANLRSQSIKSCGCLRKQNNINQAIKNRKPPGTASFNRLFRNYKLQSKYRNLVFNLNQEEFKKLIDGFCYYCGNNPEQYLKDYGNDKSNGHYKYNGIDRINSSKGYELNNCVTCCKICNVMKMSSSKESFLDKIEKIYKLHYIKEVLE